MFTKGYIGASRSVRSQEAIKLAKIDATNVESEKWNCYDCKYWVDEPDVEIVE